MQYSPNRFCLTISVLVLFVFKGYAQTNYNMPAIISPSPQSQALTRYGDYPMTSYTGLTDITIPLHTITSRKLTLPITMSFHASGRMANEVNGILGMRWTLNCGGLVTRTMKGQPDEWDNLATFDVTPYLPTSSVVNVPPFEVLHNACPDGKTGYLGSPVAIYDSEYDVFTYALPNGKQGHFILKNVNGEKFPMIIPYEPLKIEIGKQLLSGGVFIVNMKITDVDGTQYTFGKLDASTANAVEYSEEWHHPLYGTDNSSIPTAWYLTKISSNDGTDEISISYTTKSENPDPTAQSAQIWDRRRNSSVLYISEECALDPYVCNLMNQMGYNYYWRQTPSNSIEGAAVYLKTTPLPSNIQFNGGSVSFSYINSLLSEVTVKRTSVPYKKIKFNLRKHAGEDIIYHLDNIAFYGEDQMTVNEKYSFSYYDGGNSGPQPSAKRDWWGYYNRYASNLLPYRAAEQVTYWKNGAGYQDVGFQNVQRGADVEGEKMGMLKTITYPTGGETEFIYEGNISNYQDAPGLRIREVISKPVVGKNIHKIYKYGINENGNGFINEYLRPGTPSFSELMIAESNAMHFWNYYTQEGSGNQSFPWEHIEQMGYRTRDYLSDPYIRFDLGGSQIKYNAVTEYYLEEGQPRQKTLTTYSWGDNEQLSDFIVHDYDEPIYHQRKFSNPENACLRPVLRTKTVYKYSNNAFEPLRKETYDYDFQQKDEAWDMPTYLHTAITWARYTTSGSMFTSDYYNAARDYHNNSCSVYGYGFRHYITGTQLLYNTSVEEFTPTGTITTEKHYDYENTYHLLRSQQTENSKKETIETTYSYPFDFATVPVYLQMIQKNILSPVVEQSTNKVIEANNTFLNSTKTNYDFWNGTAWSGTSTNIIVPRTIQSKVLNQTNYEDRISYDSYDDIGNITTVSKENDVKKTYLWGYNKTYPVAEVTGADYEIASSYITQGVLDAATGNGDDVTLRNHLNNLRNIPNALVTIYTYKPLVGITSATDPNGRITYYEYDNFGRLSLVRDKDDNILKKYAYDYVGQCTTCGTMPSANWQATGSTRAKPCEANAAFNGPYGQREEKDMNPSSATYNQTRWVDYYIQFGDPLYDPSLHDTYEQYWVNTSTPPKCIKVSGQNTGEQEQEQAYTGPNPCNTFQGYIRWKNIGTNTNACPLPAFFTSSDFSGNYYSSVCTSPAEPDPIYVSVPAGMFTSTISVVDADEQALQYAQTYADQHGSCTVPPITFNFINNAGGGFTVTLTDVNTGQEYTLHSTNGANAYLQNLPQGTYHIYLSPSSTDWIYYEVGCDYFIESTGDVFLYDITISSSCNTITAN